MLQTNRNGDSLTATRRTTRGFDIAVVRLLHVIIAPFRRQRQRRRQHDTAEKLKRQIDKLPASLREDLGWPQRDVMKNS